MTLGKKGVCFSGTKLMPDGRGHTDFQGKVRRNLKADMELPQIVVLGMKPCIKDHHT